LLHNLDFHLVLLHRVLLLHKVYQRLKLQLQVVLHKLLVELMVLSRLVVPDL
jgi:hypothetical protein